MVEWTHERSARYGVTPFSMGDAGEHSLLPGQVVWGGDASHTVWSPNAILKVRLGDLRLLVNGFLYHRTMPLVGTFDDPDTREAQRGLRGALTHERHLNTRLALTTRLYGGHDRFAESSQWGESFWCLPEQVDGCRFEMSAGSRWAGLEQQLVADWWVDGKLVTTLGYDARVRDFESQPAQYRDRLTGAWPRLELPHTERSSTMGALFGQQVWRPFWLLALNVGGRLDLEREHGLEFSPRAAVVLTPAQNTVLRLSYNEAFRAPSLYETTEFDPTYRVTPQSLRPEKVRSLESELQQRIGRLNLSLRGYLSSYQDFIDARTATAEEVAASASRLSPTVDPALVLVNDNLTSLRVLGGSASAQFRSPAGLGLGATFNVARTSSPGQGDPERLPRWYGNFRVGWEPGEHRASLVLIGAYAGDRRVMMAFDPTPYEVDGRLDLRLTAAGPLGQGPALSWRATIGFDVNPKLPYLIANATDTAEGYVLQPHQPRLFGFLGLRYQFGAADAGF
jgi:outer membrane receptor protein involved in Fe transport